MKITKEIYDKISEGDVFASGVIENKPEGIYMVSSSIGRLLRWVAVKGDGIPGRWRMYVLWAKASIDTVRNSGDKVLTNIYVRRAIDVDDEVFALYER